MKHVRSEIFYFQVKFLGLERIVQVTAQVLLVVLLTNQQSSVVVRTDCLVLASMGTCSLRGTCREHQRQVTSFISGRGIQRGPRVPFHLGAPQATGLSAGQWEIVYHTL